MEDKTFGRKLKKTIFKIILIAFFAASYTTISLAANDSDSDGFPDNEEISYGSDPFDSSSFPEFSSLPLAVIVYALKNNTSNETPENPSQVFDAQAFYSENLEHDMVQSKCVLCHVSGGLAQTARILFNKGPDEAVGNFQALLNYLTLSDVTSTDVLNKVRGVGHGGGTQIASSDPLFNKLELLLNNVDACNNCESTDDSSGFFDGVIMASPQQILRKSNLILTGRFPTKADYIDFEKADRATKKQLLMNSFSGEEFKYFLKNGANDRLLLRALINGNGLDFPLARSNWVYPDYWNIFETFYKAANYEEHFWQGYPAAISESLREEPLELIAHVVENDKPYSEILTADYTMVNAYTNEYYRAGIDFDYIPSKDFEYGKGLTEYRVGRNRGQLISQLSNVYENETVDAGQRPGLIISHNNEFLEYPHAGILNSFAFLQRYPNTETNRNRALSRWTYYHFLDVDIEKSAPRSQKIADLTDKNNPTLNNPNCAVCHEIMDPVAGAFQNYGILFAVYRSWHGINSLPSNYIWPPDGSESLYQEGDIWYRDMRPPAFNGELIPDDKNSLQWLANKIVNNDRFALATVKFWWPAVMGQELYEAPEDKLDSDFDLKLKRYEAQQFSIKELADAFREQGLNLKSLLADMVLSPWFAASTIDAQAKNIDHLSDLGRGQLLTPEKVSRKIRALSGFSWGQTPKTQKIFPGRIADNINGNIYDSFFGGIDFYSEVRRPRDFNVSMYNVMMRQADSMSTPMTMIDFAKPDAERNLFAGISLQDIPTNPDHETKLRQKLSELHLLFWGDVVEARSAEVDISFEALKQVYNFRSQNNYHSLYSDYRLMVDPLTGTELLAEDYASQICSCEITTEDNSFMKGTWSAILRYFMTSVKFVYE